MITIPDTGKVIETPQYHLWAGADGIIRVVYKAGVKLSLDELKQLLGRIHEAAGGQKALVISDFTNMRQFGVDVTTREYATGSQAAQLLLAVAIVGQNPISRMLANLLIYMTSSSFPMRSFGDEASAIAWLQSVASSANS